MKPENERRVLELPSELLQRAVVHELKENPKLAMDEGLDGSLILAHGSWETCTDGVVSRFALQCQNDTSKSIVLSPNVELDLPLFGWGDAVQGFIENAADAVVDAVDNTMEDIEFIYGNCHFF